MAGTSRSRYSESETRNLLCSLHPGFEFNPSDDELVQHYLVNMVLNRPLPFSGIPDDVDLRKYTPEDLSRMYPALGGDVWYFFSKRHTKSKSSKVVDRTAGTGFWRMVTPKVPVSFNGNTVGERNVLVFHHTKEIKTDWIMHEFTAIINKKRLDDWNLCKIYVSRVAKNRNSSSRVNQTAQPTNNIDPLPTQQLHSQAIDEPSGSYAGSPSSPMAMGSCLNYQQRSHPLVRDGEDVDYASTSTAVDTTSDETLMCMTTQSDNQLPTEDPSQLKVGIAMNHRPFSSDHNTTTTSEKSLFLDEIALGIPMNELEAIDAFLTMDNFTSNITMDELEAIDAFLTMDNFTSNIPMDLDTIDYDLPQILLSQGDFDGLSPDDLGRMDPPPT